MLSSHAVVPGTVQLPSQNEPIVLMADAQTTGGYPRIACVIQADLRQLAQLPRNAEITFQRCNAATAQQALHRQRALINRVKFALLHRSPIIDNNDDTNY